MRCLAVITLALLVLTGCQSYPLREAAKAHRDGAAEFKRIRPLAEQGDAGAQFNLGILYAEGKGVLKDPITAHMWYNIGSANASNGMAGTLAPVYRDNIERIMTSQQIAEATKRAKVCMSSDYEDCD